MINFSELITASYILKHICYIIKTFIEISLKMVYNSITVEVVKCCLTH